MRSLNGKGQTKEAGKRNKCIRKYNKTALLAAYTEKTGQEKEYLLEGRKLIYIL